MSRREASSHGQRTGVPCFLCSPLPHCPLCSFPGPENWLCPSPCVPPAHQERRGTGGARTYLPRAHGDRQRVCLSHLCCWNGVWRRKEKPFVPQRAPVHPCCLLMGLGAGSVPAAHGACSKAAAPLLGTCHASRSETLLLAAGRDGGKAGGSGTHPKQGAPFSLRGAPFLLPAMARSWHTCQGTVPNSPFSFPEARPLLGKTSPSWSGELRWGARAARYVAVSKKSACASVPAPAPRLCLPWEAQWAPTDGPG